MWLLKWTWIDLISHESVKLFSFKSDFEFPEAHEKANDIDWRMSHVFETLRANKKCNLPSRENQTSKHLQEQIKFSETIFFRTKENYTAFKSFFFLFLRIFYSSLWECSMSDSRKEPSAATWQRQRSHLPRAAGPTFVLKPFLIFNLLLKIYPYREQAPHLYSIQTIFYLKHLLCLPVVTSRTHICVENIF